MTRSAAITTIVVLLALAAPEIQAATFNVNEAFVANETPDGGEQNPNGNYAYGYSLTPSTVAAFSTANLVHSDAFNGNAGVSGYFIQNNAIVPAILGNVTGSLINTNFGASMQSHELLLHPGGLGGDAFVPPIASAVVRYTTAAAGTYTISGSFENLSSGVTDIHVLINGASGFFDGLDAGTFNFAQLLPAGTAIDFVVGPSTDGIGSDSTGLYADIQFAPVPEPATVVLFGLGAVGLFVAARRRRSA